MVEEVMSAFLREQKVSSQCSSRVRCAMWVVHLCVNRSQQAFVPVYAERCTEVSTGRSLLHV